MKDYRRDDIDYLLTSHLEDFEFYGCAEAVCLLTDSLEDMDLQLKDVPKTKFTGKDYEDWKLRCSYKRNRISSVLRQFRWRLRWLIMEHNSAKYKDLLLRVLEGDEAAIREAEAL